MCKCTTEVEDPLQLSGSSVDVLSLESRHLASTEKWALNNASLNSELDEPLLLLGC